MVYNMKYKKKLVGGLFRFVLIILFSDEKNWVGPRSVDAFIMLCWIVKIVAFASIVHFIISSLAQPGDTFTL